MKKDWKFWHWDHVGVCLTAALLASVIGLVSVNLSMFNPVEQAFENFHMTDVYYEMSRSEDIELNNDIVMVDMVELRDRGEIGQVIQQINACQPPFGTNPSGGFALTTASDPIGKRYRAPRY